MSLEAASFNNVAATEGLVEVLKTIVGNDVGVRLDKDGNETTIPAIMTGGGVVPAANFPRITIDYQGSNGGHKFQEGWVAVEDPEDPPNIIDVPYFDQYLVYSVTVTVESGSKDQVLEAYANLVVNGTQENPISSSDLAQKVVKSLMIQRVRALLQDTINSTVRYDDVTISPVFNIDQTQIQDSSTITLFFDTVDRIIDYGGGVFESIEREGELYRNEEDTDPIIITGTTGPTTP